VPQPTPRRASARPRATRRPAPGIELSEMLCFDLYAASRAVTAAYRVLLEGLGVTYPQYLVLVVLWREGPCQVKELAERLQLDYGTLTPLLRRMEVAGLVTRRRRPEDERSVEIALTTTGSALEKPSRELQPAVLAAFGLSREEAISLQETLRHVTDSAKRSAAG
jgi:DNA-binding MarR family transcriptional regulator